MRKLYILRGAPASGKSTFIKNNDLSIFTISSDLIRINHESINYDLNGNKIIGINYEYNTWKLLRDLVEIRMMNGSLTFVDATNTTYQEIKLFIKLAKKYNYEFIVINFLLGIDELTIRNAGREEIKRVNLDVVQKFYNRLQKPLPENIKQIKPDDFKLDFRYDINKDFSNYEKIIFIGDVQGCFESLNNYFIKNPINNNYLYIFTGDYIDRGIENHLVIDFLLKKMNRKNFLFIMGNHEIHLWNWARDIKSSSKIFNSKTLPQIEQHGIKKETVLEFCNRLLTHLFFKFHDKEFVVSHGGLPFFPNEEQRLYMSDNSYIKGIGSYADDIDSSFNNNCGVNQFQIHGHRNKLDYEIINGNSYNLEGKVEFGGYLRILEIGKDHIKTIYEKQNIIEEKNKNMKDLKFIDRLRKNELIKEKNLGENISSFNFKRKVFYDKLWCENTMKARGLFLNNATGNIIARSYDKFFNINELKETSIEELKNNLKFPITAYKKENGYLGIASVHNGQPFFASKSTNSGHFAGWFSDLMFESVNMEYFMKKACKGFTFVFEVIDIANDPHIIEYDQSQLVLLDIIYNKEEFKKLNYQALKQISNLIGVKCKEIENTFMNWEEFEQWYNIIKDDMSINIEGYVIEDASNFCFKIKLPFYNFWKSLRSERDRLLRDKSYVTKNDKMTEAVEFMKKMDDNDLKKGMIYIRNQFFKLNKKS